MKRSARSASKKPSAPTRRTVICVDPDEVSAMTLHSAWLQLRFADDLHIVSGQEEALTLIRSSHDGNGHASLAAVVVDPDATGEETGPFVRKVRKYCGKDAVPIVFWSRDSDKYKVLEGRGVESVLKKPMVLRLIQSLDAACKLRVQHFQPFAGSSVFEHTNPQPSVGLRA